MKKAGATLALILTLGPAMTAHAQEEASAAAPAADTARAARMRAADDQLRIIMNTRAGDTAAWKALDLYAREKKGDPVGKSPLYRQKVEDMIGLCSEEKFAVLADVDSVEVLATYDRVWCKQRLKLLNPLIP